MPRRREVPERTIIPDSRYNNKLVAKFINCIMRDGKRSIAESLLYDAFDLIESGSWPGNDTLWRMIYDMTKVIYYGDKNGKVHERVQRKVFHLVCRT